jgi:hypothetical protein
MLAWENSFRIKKWVSGRRPLRWEGSDCRFLPLGRWGLALPYGVRPIFFARLATPSGNTWHRGLFHALRQSGNVICMMGIRLNAATSATVNLQRRQS